MNSIETRARYQLRVVKTGAVHNITATPLIIGSHDTVDVCIKDRLASRRHAEVFCQQEGVVLRDLDSKNGTWLGRKPVTQAVLRDKEGFQIGKSEFLVEALVGSDFIEDDVETVQSALKKVRLDDRTEADAPPSEAPATFEAALYAFEADYVAKAIAAARSDPDVAAKIAGLTRSAFDSLCRRVEKAKATKGFKAGK